MATFALAEAFRLAIGEPQLPRGSFSLRDLLYPWHWLGGCFALPAAVQCSASSLGLCRRRRHVGQFLCLRLRKTHRRWIPRGRRYCSRGSQQCRIHGLLCSLLESWGARFGTSRTSGRYAGLRIAAGANLVTEQPEIFGCHYLHVRGQCFFARIEFTAHSVFGSHCQFAPAGIDPLGYCLCLAGGLLTTFSVFDLALMLLLALGATVLRAFGFPLAPLLLGFILSGLFEENLQRALMLSDGDVAYLLNRPLPSVFCL